VEFEALECRGRIDALVIQELRRELRTNRFGLMHCLSNRTISNGNLAGIGIPIPRIAYRGTVGHVSRWDPLSWLTYLHPGMNRIVCVSEAVRSYLKQYVQEERLVVIHKGHNPSWYRRAPRRNLSAYGIPDDAFVVGCVANMRPVKGVPVLIEAFQRVSPELNPHLLLIGRIDASGANALGQKPPKGDRVHAVGFQPDPSELVSQCDCFVMPSVEREGLPKALLEAMSVGVACIVTDVGGMPEVVNDQCNGLVVPPRNAEALRMAIERLGSDPELTKRLSHAALETIKGPLSVEHTIRKTAELYRELLV
jgi:glycosyltransferase involved in cell wall biosynthesis